MYIVNSKTRKSRLCSNGERHSLTAKTESNPVIFFLNIDYFSIVVLTVLR